MDSQEIMYLRLAFERLACGSHELLLAFGEDRHL